VSKLRFGAEPGFRNPSRRRSNPRRATSRRSLTASAAGTGSAGCCTNTNSRRSRSPSRRTLGTHAAGLSSLAKIGALWYSRAREVVHRHAHRWACRQDRLPAPRTAIQPAPTNQVGRQASNRVLGTHTFCRRRLGSELIAYTVERGTAAVFFVHGMKTLRDLAPAPYALRWRVPRPTSAPALMPPASAKPSPRDAWRPFGSRPRERESLGRGVTKDVR
jgi:hypothetical protein